MEKVELPIKTKVAAWYLMVLGLSGTLISAYFSVQWFLGNDGKPLTFEFLFSSLSFIIFLFLFLTGLFILKKKRWAWRVAQYSSLAVLMILNFNPISLIFWAVFITHLPQCFLKGDCYINASMGINGNILSGLLWFVTYQIPFLIPLVLLRLDRKNFWKIAQ